MAYKYTGRKGGSKPSKKKFGFEITDVKTTNLSAKNKSLVEITEEIQQLMRHPEKVCECRRTGKQWHGCAGMEKGDACPKMSMKLKEYGNRVEELKNQPDEEPAKEGSCYANISAKETTCGPEFPKVQHPLATSYIDYMAALKQHQAQTAKNQ